MGNSFLPCPVHLTYYREFTSPIIGNSPHFFFLSPSYIAVLGLLEVLRSKREKKDLEGDSPVNNPNLIYSLNTQRNMLSLWIMTLMLKNIESKITRNFLTTLG